MIYDIGSDLIFYPIHNMIYDTVSYDTIRYTHKRLLENYAVDEYEYNLYNYSYLHPAGYPARDTRDNIPPYLWMVRYIGYIAKYNIK